MLALEDSWGATLEAVKFLSFQALLPDHYRKWGTSQWVGSSHVIQCKQGYSPTGMPRGQSDLQNFSLRLSLHDSRLYKVDGFKTTHFTILSSHKPSLTAQAWDLPLLWTLKGAWGAWFLRYIQGVMRALEVYKIRIHMTRAAHWEDCAKWGLWHGCGSTSQCSYAYNIYCLQNRRSNSRGERRKHQPRETGIICQVELRTGVLILTVH